LPRGFAQRGDPSAGALRAALLRGAALWHEGLKRSQALQVPGLVVDQPIAADTVLLRIPKELHFSRPRCEEIFKNLYEACEALPSADPEKRAEAADALCFAKVLQSCAAEKCTSTAQRECQGPSTWPEAWGHVAATLLSNVEDFADHPYVAAWEGRMPQLCSAEPELIAAQAQYVRTVYGCLQSTVTEMPKELDEGLFAFSWLCLLTRRFRGPEGSALVPGVDFLNHSSKPNAASEWDEASGSIVVTSLVDLQPGDEVCISYGNLSNPLLFRTYGFTLPCEPLGKEGDRSPVMLRFEPCCSCTFTQEELVAGRAGLPDYDYDYDGQPSETSTSAQAAGAAGDGKLQVQVFLVYLGLQVYSKNLQSTDQLTEGIEQSLAPLEAALALAEAEGAPLHGHDEEPWHLPRSLHRLAPLAWRHQRRLERFRSRVEELLASPSVELLEIPQEAEAYEVAGGRQGFNDRIIDQARKLCFDRGLTVLKDEKERYLMLRLGPAEKAQPLDPPATVLVSARRNDTLPEEQVTTNAKGMCFLPDGAELTSCLKITLPDEPGLLPVMVSLKALRQGWHQEPLLPDPQMLRALMLPGSGRCYLSLGGARSHFPSHGWQPAQLRLRFALRENVRCTYAGCTWTGHEGDLASHQLQCEEISRIRRALEARRPGGATAAPLQAALTWCSEETRSDLDAWRGRWGSASVQVG
ncbi:CLIP-associated protein, partial [Durusdinium trenchii]